MLTDAERWDLALSWFKRAAECTFEGLAALRMETLLRVLLGSLIAVPDGKLFGIRILGGDSVR